MTHCVTRGERYEDCRDQVQNAEFRIRGSVECEHCHQTTTMEGWDDIYFWEKVLPNVECKNCYQIVKL